MNPRQRWWVKALLPGVAASMTCALLAAAVHGPLWGWVTATIGLLLLLVAQVRNLVDFLAWLDLAREHLLPEAEGIWGEVFVRLSRRLREEARRQTTVEASLKSLRSAMDAVPDGLVLLDADHRIQWLNRIAGAHLGLLPLRDQGMVIEQLVRPPGFAEFLAALPEDASYILQTGTERTRAYALRVLPLANRQRLLISADVTDAQRVEAMRREFVANVSHELRTPLTVVSGFLEHFTEAALLDEAQRRHFARLMSEQTARMLSLVDDLLTLSHLEADDAPASEEIVDMDELLALLVREGEGLSEGRHRISSCCAPWLLRGNRKELHSAFGNLLSNAVRYTPAGGEISVTWSIDSGRGVLAVQDSGPGIAAEHLPRLTERFYRVDRGRSRETGGTGLGLAIVKHILLRHQATLHIESQLGAGSTFRAEFPAARLLAAQWTRTAPDKGVPSRNRFQDA